MKVIYIPNAYFLQKESIQREIRFNVPIQCYFCNISFLLLGISLLWKEIKYISKTSFDVLFAYFEILLFHYERLFFFQNDCSEISLNITSLNKYTFDSILKYSFLN